MKKSKVMAVGLLCALLVMTRYLWTGPNALEHVAQRVRALEIALPHHVRISAATVRMQQDDQGGCWVALGYVLPEVEAFYQDGHYVRVKNFPVTSLMQWIQMKSKAWLVWMWDAQTSLESEGRFFSITEVEMGHFEEKRDIYLRVKSEACPYHEGSRVYVYGRLAESDWHALLLGLDEGKETSVQKPV